MDMKQLAPLILQIALILMIGSIGLRAKWRDVLSAVTDFRGLLRALLAVNVVVPLVAVLTCMVLPIEPAIKAGIIIMAVSPLAPLVPGKLIKAGMDASRTTGLYVVLIALAVLIVPLTIGLLDKLLGAAVVAPIIPIASLVIMKVMIPLAAGMLVAAAAPNLAKRLTGPFNLIGMIGLGLIALAIVATQAGQIAGLVGNGAVLAMTATTAAGIMAGHLLGGADPVNRMSLALAASTRHPGIAALIINANFDGDRRVMLSVILFVLTSLLVSAAYQIWLKLHLRPETAGAPA